MSEKTGGENAGYTPPATQEELNRIVDARLARERAKYSDYEDLKAKAAKFDQAQNDSKTAEQKFNDRITELEAQVSSSKSEAVRARIQAKHAISDEDAALFLTGSDPDQLEKQAKALADRVADRKSSGPVVTAQTGSEAATKLDPLNALADGLFGSQN